jgi:hypothetical protein
MTSYANPAVYQCPACMAFLLRARMRSFNSYGARSWSDGYSTFSCLPAMSPLIRCPSCVAVFWQEDFSALGEMPKPPTPPSTDWLMRLLDRLGGDENGDRQAWREWDRSPEEWKSAKADSWLEYLDLKLALRADDLTTDREIIIRRRLWWASNDKFRQRVSGIPRSGPVASKPEAIENMERLIEMLRQADRGVNERAELLRQLGHFEDAVTLLVATSESGRPTGKAAETQAWALARDSGLKLYG